MAKNPHNKLIYPPGCKELTDDVGKDELIRRLKVRNSPLSSFEFKVFYTATVGGSCVEFFIAYKYFLSLPVLLVSQSIKSKQIYL